MLRLTPLLLLTALLSGCASPMVIPDVSVDEPTSLQAFGDSRALSFKRGIVKLDRGQEFGAMQVGLACLPSKKRLTWKGGSVDFTSEEMVEVFLDQARKYNYNAVGDPSALFVDRSSSEAELLVAALITDMRMNVCYPMAGFGDWDSGKGEGYMRVEWQIYSPLERQVILKTETEGVATVADSVPTVELDLLYNAFAAATKNLLANEAFKSIAVNQPSKQDNKYTEAIVLRSADLSRKNLREHLSDARLKTVTVRSALGHGSGFFLGDGKHVLTNEHVVQDAQYVRVVLVTGRELVGEVIRKSKVTDVALIRTEDTHIIGFPVRPDLPRGGADVFAIGTPLDEGLSSTISKGIVSGYRSINGQEVLQSDVNIQPGNSGGPLLDKNGNVVAIAVSGFRLGASSTGINFFVPISKALESISVDLKEHE